MNKTISEIDGTYIDLGTPCIHHGYALCNPRGYSQVRNKDTGKHLLRHRVSYEVNKGPIKPGNVVQHLCNNPKCINPLHLIQSTISENNLWIFKSGNWKRKLEEEDVIQIKKLHKLGYCSRKELAEKFHVSYSTICKIMSGEIWSWVLI